MIEEQDGIRCETGIFRESHKQGGKKILEMERNSPREQRDRTTNAFTTTLKVLEASGSQNGKILIC